MSLFSEQQLDEILHDTLEKIKEMHCMYGVTELSIESVAVAQAYINSRKGIIERDENEADLVRKVENAVSYWKENHHSKVMVDLDSKAKRTQVILRIATSKLSKDRLNDISQKESEVLHAALYCLSHKENKYSSDLRFEKMLKDNLEKYDSYLAESDIYKKKNVC